MCSPTFLQHLNILKSSVVSSFNQVLTKTPLSVLQHMEVAFTRERNRAVCPGSNSLWERSRTQRWTTQNRGYLLLAYHLLILGG